MRCNRAATARWKKEDPARFLFSTAKSRAARSGVPFTISIEDVRGMWPEDGRCPALGIVLSKGPGVPHDASPTLDRMNSAWGYEKGNVAVLSHRANRAKGALTASELESIARWMRARGLD